MGKRIFISFFVLSGVSIFLFGCGQQNIKTDTELITEAIRSDTTLFEALKSEEQNVGTNQALGTQASSYPYLWWRSLPSLTSINVSDIAITGEAATAKVTIDLAGTLHLYLTKNSTDAAKSMLNILTGYIYLTYSPTSKVWSVSKVSPLEITVNNSKVTISSVKAVRLSNSSTIFEMTSSPSASSWQTLSSLPTLSAGDSIEVTARVSVEGATYTPFVFLHPHFTNLLNLLYWRMRMYDDGNHNDGEAGDGFFAMNFTLPTGETSGRKRLTFDVLTSETLTLESAPYDSKVWSGFYQLQ